MNSFPPRIGVAAWRINVDGLAAFPCAASAGMAFVEIDFGGPHRGPDLGEQGVLDAHKNEARQCGLTIEALAINQLNDIGLTAPPETESGARIRDILTRAIQAARYLEAARIIVPGFRKSIIKDEGDFVTTAGNLSFAASLAGNEGIGVSYETNLPPCKMLELVHMIGKQNVTIQFDTGNPALANRSAAEMWPELRGVAAPHVHVKDIAGGDAEDVCLGGGRANLPAAFLAFARHGWPEGFVLEGDYRQDADARIRRDLIQLHRMIGDAAAAMQGS